MATIEKTWHGETLMVASGQLFVARGDPSGSDAERSGGVNAETR